MMVIQLKLPGAAQMAIKTQQVSYMLLPGVLLERWDTGALLLIR
jgi:hypothetical protein